MRPATPAEIDGWDDLLRANPDGGDMLQTRVWGEFKRRGGWRPAYQVSDGPGPPLAVLFLRRHVPGLGHLWYAPKGPGVAAADQLAALLAERDGFAGAFCVQVEPELPDTDLNRSALLAIGLRKSADVQISRATVIVDLARDEAAILASFRRTMRYDIRMGIRLGVTVEAAACSAANVATMHALMAPAFHRGPFPLRPLAYYAGCWRLFEASGQGQLFLARQGGEVVAGAFVTQLGEKAWYKDGGSAVHRRELQAPHLLQWEVMRWLRRRGVRAYDLSGVPRAGEAGASSPLQGLKQFKTGFSSDVREFVGTWDLVLDQRRYRLWKRIGEPVVRRARWRLHHDLLY
jgi:lipid II:glycine glycyltransferase (peptidoglycan interpeptide bridge formation enzyme)